MAVLRSLRFTDALLGVGSLGTLVAAMAAIDETVRGQLVSALSGDFSNNLTLAGASLQRTAHMVMETVGTDTAGQSPLVFFVLAAIALLLLMLRP